MLIKVPVCFNLVLLICPSYGPWKSLKSPWIWFWENGQEPCNLLSQQGSITAFWPVLNYAAWWWTHTYVNNLPRVVTWQWNGQKLIWTLDLLVVSYTSIHNITPPSHTRYLSAYTNSMSSVVHMLIFLCKKYRLWNLAIFVCGKLLSVFLLEWFFGRFLQFWSLLCCALLLLLCRIIWWRSCLCHVDVWMISYLKNASVSNCL